MNTKVKALIGVSIKALVTYAICTTIGGYSSEIEFLFKFLPIYGFFSYFHFFIKLLGFVGGFRISAMSIIMLNLIMSAGLGLDSEVQFQIVMPIILCVFIPICDIPFIFDIVTLRRRREGETIEEIPKIHISPPKPEKTEFSAPPKVDSKPEIESIPKIYKPAKPKSAAKLLPEGNSPPQETEMTFYPE